MARHNNTTDWGSMSVGDVLTTLKTSVTGLSFDEVKKRREEYGENILARKNHNALTLIIRQFTSNPLIIILAVATTTSYLLGQHTSSYYIFAIILLSIGLGLWNEFTAEKTVENLLKKVTSSIVVIRQNLHQEIATKDVTIGDIIMLTEGNIVPADARLIEVKDLEMNEASLTGESQSVMKIAGSYSSRDPELVEGESRSLHKNSSRLSSNNTDSGLSNMVYMGTSVVDGSGKAVVVAIGSDTSFGKIAKAVTFIKPITEFQRGLMAFGSLIIKIIGVLTVGIFVINTLLGHSFLDSLLFSLAIAVGLTPELLPVIVTISLSHGAGKLAKKHVIAKQLIAIENLGNMDILCTDKTGTLTEGNIRLVEYKNRHNEPDHEVVILGLQGIEKDVHSKTNAIDEAILEYAKFHSLSGKDKVLFQEPFSFERKALFFVKEKEDKAEIIMRGAAEVVLHMCKGAEKHTLLKEFADLNAQGIRVVAVATKKIKKKDTYRWEDIGEMAYTGYLGFVDTPKKSAKLALQRLGKLNVKVKILTGDNELVTKKICEEVGLSVGEILTGEMIEKIKSEELLGAIEKTTVFARLSPAQKLEVIKLFRSKGHAVGYLGDGVNDLPALHGADVGLSVNTAVDVAKDAASIVLLRKSLDVIAEGVTEGRKTFQNTIKYILMATSSNFGNMFSAAGASFFLTFLPMTPVQILLTNGLYDLSQTTIPSDNVDPESLVKPRHWNIKFLKSYMLFFGPISSFFDYLTFGIMLFLFHAGPKLFQTGWFVESLATEILVIFVIRTSRTPFFKSKPSIWLLGAAILIVGIGFLLPFSPLAKDLGFVSLPPMYFLVLLLLSVSYLTIVEVVKSVFLKKYSF